jgi:hypothetical protein
MKNTILTQIIKKVILTEQDGFNPVPIDEPIVPIVKKKETKVNKKVDPKVKPKETPKVKPAKIKPIPDVLLSPTPYRNPHFIYSKTADGIWRYEYLDAASESIKSGIVTNSATETALNAGKYIKWTGEYGEQPGKKGKKEWLDLMDTRDPGFPEKSQDPMIGSTTGLVVSMLATYGLQILATAASVAVLAFFKKKFRLAPVKWGMSALGIGKSSKITALIGISETEAAELERLVAVALKRKEITKSQAAELRKSFNNPWFRSTVNKSTFNLAYRTMVKGDMTMSEFIGYMPKVYRESESLKRVLLEYEAQLNRLYPERKIAWDIAAAKYAEKNSQFKRFYDKMLDKMGIPNDKNKPWWSSGTATNSSTYAPKVQGSKETAAAVATKISKSVDDAALAVRGDIETYQRMNFFTIGSFDPKEVYTKLTTINPITRARWGLSLAKGNNEEITKLLKDLAKLKKKENAIAKIKQFAIANNWKSQNEDIIEEFMLHVLKNFYSKK